MKNPFKFGTVVDEPYFINRKKEIGKVQSVLGSENHLILMSPRRFGKSSLIYKAVSNLDRPVIATDMQLVTGPADFSAQILKRIYRLWPAEKLKQHIKKFRVVPSLALNPVTGNIDVSFMPLADHLPLLEDVLNLAEKLSTERRKIIMIFDEFQDAKRIHPDLLHQMRAIIQRHKMVNYVFLGSQESLIREIFQKKKSPFYHFGIVMNLSKISAAEFREFLKAGFRDLCRDADALADEIIAVTKCHPYYTQQLAFTVWEKAALKSESEELVSEAVREQLLIHDMDYERIWTGFNTTDRKMLLGISLSELQPLSDAFNRAWNTGAPSTAFSSLKRLMTDGFVIKTDRYEIDDPFFSRWLAERRER